jgi:hypothetical protein
MTIVHPSQAPHSVPAIQTFPDRLFVVTAIDNPVRFHSRYRIYRAFEKKVADAGAILITVERAFGGRPFEVTQAGNPHHVQVRSDDELWLKENLLNLGISRLPAEARYIAWIDADVTFARPDWAQETIQQLQHYAFVQMFSHSVDLGPNEEITDPAYGWIESINRDFRFSGTSPHDAKGSGTLSSGAIKLKGWTKGAWHSGLAWAARREALNKVGGLLDTAILGSADRNMAAGLFGFAEKTIDPTFAPAYRAAILQWQYLAEKNIRRNVGQVSGTILHHWHGKKLQRGYTSRWKILSKYQFNPITDLARDSQGLWQLVDHGDARSIGLRDEIRAYFRSRNEDSIDL